jgi:hypothetical protein
MNKFENINSSPEFDAPKPEEESRPSQPESKENEGDIQGQSPAREPCQKTPEELEKIEEIRHQLQESEKSPRSQQKKSVPQNFTQVEIIDGQQYHVEYVPKEDIYPAYGYGGGNSAVVRQDLPPRVKKFVKAHELYHCQDKSNFGGWLGREIRANVIPGLKDPIGLAATVWKTITDVDRIKLYLRRIKEGK